MIRPGATTLLLWIGLAGPLFASTPAEDLDRLRADERRRPAPASEEVARRLNDIGMEYLAARDFPRAVELLGEAVARDPDNGVALANLTLAYLKNGDLEFAEFYLEMARQAIRRQNPDPRFYVALGDVYAAEQRLEDAVTAWEHALELGSRDPSVRQKLGRIQKEWAYGHGQKYFAGDRFEFFFDPAISDREVETSNENLEKSAAVLSDFFGVPAPEHLYVIFYAGRRYFHLLETPDWVGGFYDGKIRVPVEPGHVQNEAFVGLLRHELAHAFLDHLSRARAPSWLQEGLAQYVEGRRIDTREVELAGRAAIAAFPQSAESSFRQRSDRQEARLAYELSLSYVEFLVGRRGSSSTVCLAESIGRGKSLEAAFEENFGELPAALEAAWRSTLHPPR